MIKRSVSTTTIGVRASLSHDEIGVRAAFFVSIPVFRSVAEEKKPEKEN